MRVSWTRLAVLAASCLYAGSAVAQITDLNLTNHATRFILLQTEDTPCTNATLSITPIPGDPACLIGAGSVSAVFTDLTNDYFGTLTFVGTSPLPNGTGGTNTFSVAVDPVTWGRTIAPIVAMSGAVLSTATGVTVLFDADTGVLANPAGSTAESWTASLVFQPTGANIALTLHGLGDPADEPFYGSPATVGTTKPGPPIGPPLVFSCAWGKANPTASLEGVDYPGTSVCPEPFPTPAGFSGDTITVFTQTTIDIGAGNVSEAAAAFASAKWKLQEMPQTDTDGDGMPNAPSPSYLGASNNYPVKGYFDNCPFVPNGPSLGTCVGTTVAISNKTCHTNADCGGLNTCDLSQTDRGGFGSGSPPDGIGDVCQCGDINNSGTVDNNDATGIVRAVAGLAPFGVTGTANLPSGLNRCDATGTGACNNTTATSIKRKVAGLVNAYQQGKCHDAVTFP